MALIGIALLGMLLVVIILLGGHWVRRQGSHRRGPAVPPDRRPILAGSPPSSLAGQPDPALSGETTSTAAESVDDRKTRQEEKPAS